MKENSDKGDFSSDNMAALGEQGHSDKPPLVMQASNLHVNYELDNKLGGGGIEATDLNDELPAKKRVKLGVSGEDNLQDGCQSGDELMLDCPEDSPIHNESEDYINGEENGLMEFIILDEKFESDGNDDPNDGDSHSSSDAFDNNESDTLLDAKFKESKALDPNDEFAHEEKQKMVLKVKGKDHFEVLPEGWVEITHKCGMPIYLHKNTRVCTMSKPYFIGTGSTRNHKIPTSTIPCLHYLKETEKEKLKAVAEDSAVVVNGNRESADTPVIVNGKDESDDRPVGSTNDPSEAVANGLFPSAKLHSAKDTKESGSMDFMAVRRYCEKRFEFQWISVKNFSTWSERRNHQRKIRLEERPSLPDYTKIITCPLNGNSTVTGKNDGKKELIINLSGKSPVDILHEYAQRTHSPKPKYQFEELESGTPYGAAVVIGDINYGNGLGSSKKLAKQDAARAALEILIPDMKLYPREENREAVEFFDQVCVEDTRVHELSVKADQPLPYNILLECLKRNYGMGDTEIKFSLTNIKHQKNEFHMKVGKHDVSVTCKNKNEGKQRASQAILQLMHPHINSWGSLLRLYGKGLIKISKEKKDEEQRITELQSKTRADQPNIPLLRKLKDEMMKLQANKSTGKLIPKRMERVMTSCSNLKQLEL